MSRQIFLQGGAHVKRQRSLMQRLGRKRSSLGLLVRADLSPTFFTKKEKRIVLVVFDLVLYITMILYDKEQTSRGVQYSSPSLLIISQNTFLERGEKKKEQSFLDNKNEQTFFYVCCFLYVSIKIENPSFVSRIKNAWCTFSPLTWEVCFLCFHFRANARHSPPLASCI